MEESQKCMLATQKLKYKTEAGELKVEIDMANLTVEAYDETSKQLQNLNSSACVKQ